jgi:hypothetical protein
MVEIVAEHDGKALEGAEVTFLVADGHKISLISDAAGKAVFEGLATGIARIDVTAPGMESTKRRVELGNDPGTLRIALSPLLGQLTVRVFGVDGHNRDAIEDAHVRITPQGGETRSLPATNSQGAVTASDLPFGRLTILVIATGWETRIDTFDLSRKEAEHKVELSTLEPPPAE